MFGKMASRSLARRLVVSSLISAGILLVIAGTLLYWMFSVTLERQFDARLEALMNGLLANVEQADNGGIYLSRDLGDPLFRLPASGWYWQITPVSRPDLPTLASPSLLEKRFDIHRLGRQPRQADSILRLSMVGPHGRSIRLLEQRLSLFGDANVYSVLVSGDIGALHSELATFGGVIVLMFTLFGIGLALFIFLQVRYGLRPLKLLHDEIADVRDGRRKYLTGDFPEEIRPLVAELNKLIRANRDVVERARTQVGNLAHALKTPLAVLLNEAASRSARKDDQFARLVSEQASSMRQHVEICLERARRAALAGTLGVSTAVQSTLNPIVNALRRIYHERQVTVAVDCPADLRFRGEKQDLEEMLGNLLDNAFKYGGSKVCIRCRLHAEQKEMMELIIEDDGPGLTPEQRRQALQRGQRLDETRPGSGLGLSIVKELAEMYHGGLEIGESGLGGVKVVLRLPASKEHSPDASSAA